MAILANSANHFRRVCKSGSEEFGTDVLFCESTKIFSVENKICIFTINDKQISMQEDSGATVSVVPSYIWKRMGEPKLRKPTRRFIAYDGYIVNNLSKFTASIELDGIYLLADLEVIDSIKTFGLLGRDLLRSLCDMSQVVAAPAQADNFLPAIKGVKARMELLKDAKRMFCRARPVPLAMEDEIGRELDRLESQGIISKCVDPGWIILHLWYGFINLRERYVCA